MAPETTVESGISIETLVDRKEKYDHEYNDPLSNKFREVLREYECELVSWAPINSNLVSYPKDEQTKPQICLAVFYQPTELGRFPMRRQDVFSSYTRITDEAIDSLAKELGIKVQQGLDQQKTNQEYPERISWD